MCGIVTIVTPEGKSVALEILERMTTRIAHRGPDDFGYARVDRTTGKADNWTTSPPLGEMHGVLFGHRRLSILDLTPGGHQPMFSDDRSLVVAFNGEIYNYVELRGALEHHGVRFRTRSDTEVLLKAYQHWGTDAFNQFNGMWAFTLWDGRTKKLIACRDRFGVKPLYYAERDGTLVFASEIKALLAFPSVFCGFRDHNIAHFVNDNDVDADDSTMFANVWALTPGTYMEVGDQATTSRRYWNLTLDDRFRGQSADKIVERYRELLDDSVRLRVRSDVPIGTMLSGGMDSTSITALVCRQKDVSSRSVGGRAQSALSAFHHTFTACWPGWQGDEEAIVSAFCQDLGLESHKVYLSSEAMNSVLAKVIYHLDEPFSNPTSIVQYLLMEQARAHGVKVVLNGHGSDEALAGYARFVPPFLAQLLLSGHPAAFVRNLRAFRRNLRFTNRQIVDQFVIGLKRRTGRPAPSPGTPPALPAEERVRTIPYCRRADFIEGPAAFSLLGSDLWEQFASYTLPKWLRMEDRMSMAWSIESRLPFMDYRLVEMAFNLPDRLRLDDGYTKVVLRRAMQDTLPTSIVANRQKRRFSSPYGRWLEREWRPLVEDNLFGSPKLQDHMDISGLQQRFRSLLAGNGRPYYAEPIWRALSTEMFLRTHSAPTTST